MVNTNLLKRNTDGLETYQLLCKRVFTPSRRASHHNSTFLDNVIWAAWEGFNSQEKSRPKVANSMIHTFSTYSAGRSTFHWKIGNLEFAECKCVIASTYCVGITSCCRTKEGQNLKCLWRLQEALRRTYLQFTFSTSYKRPCTLCRRNRIFSVLDEKSGYWKIKVHLFNREQTAITSHHRIYQFTRMPFDLKNDLPPFRLSQMIYYTPSSINLALSTLTI